MSPMMRHGLGESESVVSTAPPLSTTVSSGPIADSASTALFFVSSGSAIYVARPHL